MCTLDKKNRRISLQTLLEKPLVSSGDLREHGYTPGLLSYYESCGILERVGRGLYRNKKHSLRIDFEEEDLVYAVLSVPRGVVTGISALSLYGVTDEIPRFHWISVPHGRTVGGRSGIKITRSRNHQFGITNMQIGDIKIPIYELERVLVEAFRYLGRETAIKSLKEALKRHKLSIEKMKDYSRKLRIDMEPYLVAVMVS